MGVWGVMARGGGGGEKGGGGRQPSCLEGDREANRDGKEYMEDLDEPNVLCVTNWVCKKLGTTMAEKGATFPWMGDMLASNLPLDACVQKSPTPPFTCSIGDYNTSCRSNCTARSKSIANGGGRMERYWGAPRDLGIGARCIAKSTPTQRLIVQSCPRGQIVYYGGVSGQRRPLAPSV